MYRSKATHPAFTLIELISAIGSVAVLIVIFVFAFVQNRTTTAHLVKSMANMNSLAKGSRLYANDFMDQIFSFSWKPGMDGRFPEQPPMDLQSTAKYAVAFEAQNIIALATNRFIGSPESQPPIQQLMPLRYSHLPLLTYLTDDIPNPITASPSDTHLIEWQANPTGYLDPESTFPYAKGFPTKAGYDVDPSWQATAIKQLWPFGSSYQVVPHAWLNDTNPQYTPSPTSPHHMIQSVLDDGTPDESAFGGRKMSEVAFPSQKVFFYEEFDDRSKRSPLYASDPDAMINLAFFDGSVRQERVNDANSAFDKNNPAAVWQQPYIPLDTFPTPKGGLGDQTPLDLRFRWTKGGLQGYDFGLSKTSVSDH